MPAPQTEWDFYATTIEDRPALVALDLALADEAPMHDRPVLLWVSVKLQQPDAAGFPGVEEEKTLSIIEDALASRLETIEAVEAGRIRGNGIQDHYFYAPDDEGFEELVLEVMEGFPEYAFATDATDDTDWDEYLGNLYPDYYEYQCMLNRRLTDALAEQGDNPQLERPVDHRMYFKKEKDRAAFLKVVTEQGYSQLYAGGNSEDKAMPYALGIVRNDTSGPDHINTVVWELCRLAEKNNGHYEGWGCDAVK